MELYISCMEMHKRMKSNILKKKKAHITKVSFFYILILGLWTHISAFETMVIHNFIDVLGEQTEDEDQYVGLFFFFFDMST